MFKLNNYPFCSCANSNTASTANKRNKTSLGLLIKLLDLNQKTTTPARNQSHCNKKTHPAFEHIVSTYLTCKEYCKQYSQCPYVTLYPFNNIQRPLNPGCIHVHEEIVRISAGLVSCCTELQTYAGQTSHKNRLAAADDRCRVIRSRILDQTNAVREHLQVRHVTVTTVWSTACSN